MIDSPSENGLIIRFDPNEFRWGPFRMENFVAAFRLSPRAAPAMMIAGRESARPGLPA